jgi:hypothetical protein
MGEGKYYCRSIGGEPVLVFRARGRGGSRAFKLSDNRYYVNFRALAFGALPRAASAAISFLEEPLLAVGAR